MDQKNDSFDAAFQTAVRLLSRRNHTRLEISRKLGQRKYTAEIVRKVIARCERLHYIDDDETARCYLRELVRKGFGTERIRYEMKKKGLFGEYVESLLSTYARSREEKAVADGVIGKHMRRFDRETDPSKRKEKIYRFMYARGFSADIIRRALKHRSITGNDFADRDPDPWRDE